MRLSVVISIALVTLCCTAFGQYSYFNTISGVLGDGIPEGVANVEVIGDSIYVFGLSYEDGNPYLLLRMYNALGETVNQNEIFFSGSFIYTGRTASFQRIPGTTDFLFSQGQWANDTLSGSLMRFNSNLDSIWSKSYDLYSPHTYFFTHTVNEEGFLIAGENGPVEGERGTFILQADFDGNTLWHSEVHAPEEGVFRNYSVLNMDTGYLLSGAWGLGPESGGYVERLDSNGQIAEYVESPFPNHSGIMRTILNTNGLPLVYHALEQEDYPDVVDLEYNSLNIYQYDLVQNELIPVSEYFAEDDWIDGYPVQMIEVEDGYVLAGGYYEESITSVHLNGWIMKINNNYEQEWYTELSYDGEETSTHFLWDVEQTSDGGYVTVGEYYNDEDPFRRTWLVQLDACGDLEWQGCEPVGVGEFEHAAVFNVFPNPAIDVLNIEKNAQLEPIVLELLDLAGRIVLSRSFNHELDIADVGSGIYLLRVLSNEGVIYAEKLIVE